MLLAIPLSIHLLNRFYQDVSHAHKARRKGCLPAPLEPAKLPFGIGILLASLQADRDQHTPDHVASRFATMGVYTFRMSILGTTNLITAEPRNIQAILATQFNDFGMGVTRSTNLKTVLGKSIFAADGVPWRQARDMMRPLFSRDNVSRLDLLEEHVQALFRCIEKDKRIAMADGTWFEPVSLASLLPSLTLDSATELFLGQSTSTLPPSLDDDELHPGIEIHHGFERMVAILGTRGHLRSFYWLYGTRELRSCVKALHKFVDSAIIASDMAKREGSSQALYDCLEVLRERCSGSDEEVREQILGVLAAGKDTTASLMSWTWYCLVRNPRVFEKLRAQTLSSFGPDPGDLLVTMTFASLKECTYLQHARAPQAQRSLGRGCG
ncbi:hypothetical protein FVER53590_29995 [Fusarium verticillioides]|nr:hypothetical protein FVER53590_29995 [Fusarium verticillioides]